MRKINPQKITELKHKLGTLNEFAKSLGFTVFEDGKKGLQGKRNGYLKCLSCGKPTLIIYDSQEVAHCVTCNANHDHISLYQRKEGITFRQAIYQLCQRVNMNYNDMMR